MATVSIFEDTESLAEGAARLIAGTIQEAIHERGLAMVALAGGSTPALAYRWLTHATIDWGRTYLFFGDERFVDKNDPRSNYAMVRANLLSRLSVPPANVFPVPTDVDSAWAAAIAYQKLLASVFEVAPDSGPPIFDLILLGLGEDGHTASLFPGSDGLSESERWVVASEWTGPQKAQQGSTLVVERVTMTFPVLNAARAVAFLVSGPSKAQALKAVIEDRPSVNVVPAAGVLPAHGTVEWLVDAQAASLL